MQMVHSYLILEKTGFFAKSSLHKYLCTAWLTKQTNFLILSIKYALPFINRQTHTKNNLGKKHIKHDKNTTNLLYSYKL